MKQKPFDSFRIKESVSWNDRESALSISYQHYPDGTYRQTRANSGVYHEGTNVVVLKGDVVVALTNKEQSGSVVSHMDTLTINLDHALE